MLDFTYKDIYTGQNVNIDQSTVKNMSPGERHLIVSMIPTPKAFIEEIQGADYVKCEYMREIANIFYGGWSFNIMKEEIVTDPSGAMWQKVHGRLVWTEDDQRAPTSVDTVAAHRIQFKRGTQTIVDLGNDTKAATTDTLKKLFNLGMNISDDVYRWTGSFLTEDQKQDLHKRILEFTKKNKVDEKTMNLIESSLVGLNRANYFDLKTKIRSLIS